MQGGYNFLPTINTANNQITTKGYTYDGAGNMTNDPVNAYTYDAEGNVVKVVNTNGTWQYVYDAFNRRVHVQTPSATTEFTYDYAGRRISSWLSPNNFGDEGRIYWDDQQFAFRATDGTTYFDHQDTLGTERMRTNYAGLQGSSYFSLPWGDDYTATVNSSGADQDNEHFALLEHDPESETEHAQFRNYASLQGRWLAPDPDLGSYDFINPQSMNRYAYVMNLPTALVDPKGLDCYQVSGGSWSVSATGADTNSGSDPPVIVCTGSFDPTEGSAAGGQFRSACSGPKLGNCVNAPPVVTSIRPGAPSNPQQPQKPKCDPLTRLGAAIKALSAAGDAAGSFNLAWVHVAAAGFLIGAGCLEPPPFEPATCLASSFGGVALRGGATVFTNLGTHQVENEVIPGIKQAVTCTPEGE